MATIRGTAGGDTLVGTDKSDRVSGLDGDDRLTGLGGNDRLDGGAGDDTIAGDSGDDTIVGGDGNDSLSDVSGSDVIDAGNGSDRFFTFRRDDGSIEVVSIAMGDGRDIVCYGNQRQGSATIELGAENDTLLLYASQPGGITVATGLGQDRIELYHSYDRSAGGSVIISDFAAGDSGDFLELSLYLGQILENWQGIRNPFGVRGYLRLVQSGADTVLEIDQDGHGRMHDFAPLLTLANVDVTALTPFNLSGFAGDGSAAIGIRMVGTDAGDRFVGTTGADRIRGGDGADQLFGSAGNDRLWGDRGDDALYGGAGNDHLSGGDGRDYIYDDGGSNIIDGGAGDDYIYHMLGAGGAGGGSGIESITAGEGDDFVRYQNSRPGSLTLDLGSGDDTAEIYTYQDGGTIIMTGEGHDTVMIGWDTGDHFLGTLVVTDFTAGWSGDRLQFRQFLGGALIGWDGASDPFWGGYARVVATDTGIVIEIDRDAAGTAQDFVALVTLDGVAAADLVAFNLDGFDQGGPVIARFADPLPAFDAGVIAF